MTEGRKSVGERLLRAWIAGVVMCVLLAVLNALIGPFGLDPVTVGGLGAAGYMFGSIE